MERDVIDLRSDTVTKPTAEMLAAMSRAELGDDGIDGDPTTRRLEERAAALVGHEAAVYMPSGTMCNLVGARLHTRPGDEILLEAGAHVYQFEFNGLGAVAGLVVVPLAGERGHLTPARVGAALERDIPRGPGPRLLWIENTANLAGGTVLGVGATRALVELAHGRGLAVHLDGARVMNAAVALGVSPAELAAPADTMMFCLSKGLGCPVGSLLCGSADAMAAARELRRQMGGTMRQSGVLAAAGLVALETGIERLADDHANAAWLAAKLAELPGLQVALDRVDTNIVWFECADREWPARCRARGVWFSALGDGRCRVVTHRDVDRKAVETAFERMAQALEEG